MRLMVITDLIDNCGLLGSNDSPVFFLDYPQHQGGNTQQQGESPEEATPDEERADGVEYFDLSTPTRSDPVARQLFSVADARQAIPSFSDSQRRRESEGECKAGIVRFSCVRADSLLCGRREQIDSLVSATSQARKGAAPAPARRI